ncbi:hypothetical protein C3988_00056 [Escherichia coli]|nr:hypothetical protein C3988_00056 [Escherichia coli]
MWYQKTLTLSAKSRGFHLVTDEILNQLADMPRVNIGLLHLLLQHTSASLTLNENCDPTVRHDMERFFLRTVPDNGNYEHDYEGADDMPSHIKSSMLGTCLLISNPQCWEHRLYCRYIKGVFRPAPGKASGWGNIASTADRVASSRHYKGSKK